MDDWCRDEEARLLKRTDELRDLTRALALNERQFSQAEHDDLREQVARHHQELIAYPRRVGRYRMPTE